MSTSLVEFSRMTTGDKFDQRVVNSKVVVHILQFESRFAGQVHNVVEAIHAAITIGQCGEVG